MFVCVCLCLVFACVCLCLVFAWPRQAGGVCLASGRWCLPVHAQGYDHHWHQLELEHVHAHKHTHTHTQTHTHIYKHIQTRTHTQTYTLKTHTLPMTLQVYSRFRPLRTCRSDSSISMCAAFCAKTNLLVVGSHSGGACSIHLLFLVFSLHVFCSA